MGYYALHHRHASRVFLVGIDRARFRGVVEPASRSRTPVDASAQSASEPSRARAASPPERSGSPTPTCAATPESPEGCWGEGRDLQARPPPCRPISSTWSSSARAWAASPPRSCSCARASGLRARAALTAPAAACTAFSASAFRSTTGFHYLGRLDEGGNPQSVLQVSRRARRLSIHHPRPRPASTCCASPGYEFRVPAGWGPFTQRLESECPRREGRDSQVRARLPGGLAARASRTRSPAPPKISSASTPT